MKLLSVILLFCLAGCADRYSLDERRGPDPQGFATNNPLILPPDYLLRAPEPAKAEAPAKPAEEAPETKEKED